MSWMSWRCSYGGGGVVYGTTMSPERGDQIGEALGWNFSSQRAGGRWRASAARGRSCDWARGVMGATIVGGFFEGLEVWYWRWPQNWQCCAWIREKAREEKEEGMASMDCDAGRQDTAWQKRCYSIVQYRYIAVTTR